nr:reverse transcriptase domain-containing protein [Tanacetum cinerariifolium]
MVKNELRNEMKTSIQTSLSNQTNEIKNMMASLLQMNTASTSGSGSLPRTTVANPKGELEAITTRSEIVTDGPTIPTPPKSVTQEEDECVEEMYMDTDLAEYTIKVPPPPVQKPKPPIQRHFVLLTRDSPSPNILELKCKALADLGASINLMPLSVWKKLGLPDLISTQMTLELANRAICTPDGIARDVFVPVARALIDVHGEEMILCDGDERLTLNMKHDTTIYSNHPHRDSVNLINIFNIPSEDCLEVSVSNKQRGNPTFLLHKEITSLEVTHDFHDSKGCNFLSEELPDIDSFNDIHPYFDDNPLSGSTTYSSNSLLEEFTDELALITYPPDYDDNLKCDIESDLREIEFLLYQGEDSDLKDSIDKTDLANLDDLFFDPTPEMFTDEHAPDYSFPPRFDVYDDDFLEIESDADNFYDDPFDSKGEKIKESELLIDQLDLLCDILPYSEYDSFDSQDFSRDDDLPSLDNEDKVFNPGILFHDKSVTIITRVAQEKKLAISYASLVFEDFDPSFYELLVFKEVPNSMRLLPFSSENEEKESF